MATSHRYTNAEATRWTYGAELELVDWPRRELLPPGMAVDDGNYTSVNNNGVAVDGKGRTYHLGGELLTAPSVSEQGPAEQLDQIKTRWPEATHNYRTGLNVHVRVPGLRDDLVALKRLQSFVHQVMPELLPLIDPIPPLSALPSRGEKQCYRTRLKDHHTLLSPNRLTLQLAARTPKEFFEAEAIHVETGRIHWALHARTCVNLRQMLQTDTVEFRHWFMPDSAEDLLNATVWCRTFLEAAFAGGVSAQDLLIECKFDSRGWPRGLPYDPWLDEGFYYTSPHHHPAETVKKNIEEWLTRPKRGTPDAQHDEPAEQALPDPGAGTHSGD